MKKMRPSSASYPTPPKCSKNDFRNNTSTIFSVLTFMVSMVSMVYYDGLHMTYTRLGRLKALNFFEFLWISLNFFEFLWAEFPLLISLLKEIQRNSDNSQRIQSQGLLKEIQRNSKFSKKFKDIQRNLFLSRQKDGGQPGEKHQRRLLDRTYQQVHKEFERDKGTKVSKGIFSALRPPWVQPARESDRATCLCVYHTKLKFAIEDWIANRKHLGLAPLPWKHYVEMVKELLCDPARLECLEERCEKCGPHLLEPFLLSMEKPETETDMVFGWRAVEKNDKGHLVINKRTGNPSTFITHLKSVVKGFPDHRSVVKNQAASINTLVEDLQPGELFMSRDFSEKQELKPPEQIQSWVQLTLFT